MSVKNTIQNVLNDLPDDVGWDEVQYRLCLGKIAEESNEMTKREIEKTLARQEAESYEKYVCDTVEESIRELDAGQGLSHEDAKKRLKRWLE